MNAMLVCAALFVALASCSSHSSIEQRLVGKWESSVKQEDGSTTPIESMFMADGTYSWGFPSKPRVLTGRWRIEGKDLVMTVETEAPDSGLPKLPHETRNHIVRVTAHEFVVGDQTSEGRWTR
jgi:hypothetical protein